MPKPSKIIAFVIAGLLLALSSCGPKPLTPAEEGTLKAKYLDAYGEEMTPEQKRIFRASRFRTGGDADGLLAKFREMNVRSKRVAEVKDNALALVANARAAVSACRANLGRIGMLKTQVDAAPEKKKAELQRKLKQAQARSKQSVETARGKILSAEQAVSRTPFTAEEKTDIRNRLKQMQAEFDGLLKYSRSRGSGKKNLPPAAPMLLEAIRAVQSSLKTLRESVEEEEILFEKAGQLGVDRVRGDFIRVHAHTMAALKQARINVAEADKEFDISLAPEKEKKILAEELDSLCAEIQKQAGKSSMHAVSFSR